MKRQVSLMWVVGAVGVVAVSLALTVNLGRVFFHTTARTPTRPTGKVPIEFRILADRRRDRPDLSGQAGPDGKGDPPAGYQWVKLDKRSGLETDPDLFIRADPAGDGGSVLVQLDRYNVGESHMTNVYPEFDAHLQPAIGFTFNRKGAERFGALTRTHLPEEGGAYKYRLAIILDHAVIAAPSINSEIRNGGIIEGGGSMGFTAKEVDRIISLLTK